MPKKIDDIVQDKDTQIEHLRELSRQQKTENATLRKIIGQQTELKEAVRSAIKALPPYPSYSYTPAPRNRTPVWAVLMISDWHIGEVVSKEETDGFGGYDYFIAQKRLRKLSQSFNDWVNTQRARSTDDPSGYKIETCAVFSLADFISGDIHQELLITNEFPLPVQTAKAGFEHGELIARIASNFKEVHVSQVNSDNHGRLTRKPQMKQKGINNMTFLVHCISNAMLASHSNVKIFNPESAKFVTEVAGWKFLLEHGDANKSWMGIPWYGIRRTQGREAIKRMLTDKGFHFGAIGHFHTPSYMEDGAVIINGALSGTTEFDHIQGRDSRPAQVAFLVHPKHGIFNFTAFRF